MIESAAYDIIKQEGYEEGIKAGIQQGMEKGVQQGMLSAINSILEWKFGTDGLTQPFSSCSIGHKKFHG